MRVNMYEEPGSGGDDKKSGGGGRMTTDELRERIDVGRERNRKAKATRREQRAPMMNMLRLGALGIGTVVAVGALVYQGTTAGGYESKVNANNDQLVSVRQELNDVRDSSENIKTVDVLRDAGGSAQRRSEALADVQNRMAGLRMTAASTKDDLTAYSGMVDEASAFFPDSVKSGEFLPNGQWFVGYERGVDDVGRPAIVRMSVDSWHWFPVVGVNDVKADGTVPVMWEARYTGGDKDGQVLAWVKGVYHPSSDKFSDMQRGITAEGDEHAGTSISKLPEVESGDLDTGTELYDDADDLDAAARKVVDQARRDAEAHDNGTPVDDSVAPAPSAEPSAAPAPEYPQDQDPRVAGNRPADEFRHHGGDQ